MTGGAATRIIAGLAITRAFRGKAVYVAMALIALPIILTSVRVGLGHPADEIWPFTFDMTLLLLPIVPSILVGPSLADEIEDKTGAYLWSRPLPRWSIVAGKLVGLAPIAAAILATALAVSWAVMGGPSAVPADVALRGIGGAAGAGLIGSMIVAALALLVPRHAVATAVLYLLAVDAFVGALPLKFQYVTVSFAARAVAGYTDASAVAGVLTLIAIGTLAVTIAMRRIATIE